MKIRINSIEKQVIDGKIKLIFFLECSNCNTYFLSCNRLRKLCSEKCRLEYLHHYCKKNKLCFWNSELQSRLGIKGGKIGSTKSQVIMKKKKLGWYNKEVQLKIQKKLKKLNVGFHNSEIQSALSYRAKQKMRKQRRHLFFKGGNFDSKPELEVAYCLYYQNFIIFKDNSTYHVKAGKCEYDFYVPKYNVFIEVHPYDFYGKTTLEYYLERKQNLTDSNIKEKLIVIT